MRVLNVPSHIASVAFGVQDLPPAVHRRRAAARQNRTAPPHLALVGVCAVLLEPHAVVVHTRPALRFRGHHAPPVPVGAGISRRAVSLASWFKSACVRGKGSSFHVDMKTCGTNH